MLAQQTVVSTAANRTIARSETAFLLIVLSGGIWGRRPKCPKVCPMENCVKFSFSEHRGQRNVI